MLTKLCINVWSH